MKTTSEYITLLRKYMAEMLLNTALCVWEYSAL